MMENLLKTAGRKLIVCGLCALACALAQAAGKYMVIDISSGVDSDKYPVSYLNEKPEGGWGDEFKTEKIVLRLIPAGTFWRRTRTSTYGFISADEDSKVEVKVERDFYIGVFQVTQKQWELVMGTRPSWFTKEEDNECYPMRPVENVSYDDIRGRQKGAMYPISCDVDEKSFLGRLRAKTGVKGLDLPTESMWENACRAGSDTEFNDFSKAKTDETAQKSMNQLGRYTDNCSRGFASLNRTCDETVATANVGKYKANKFDLYDTHGNVCEWCLDLVDPTVTPAPIRALDMGYDRVCKGGFFDSKAQLCSASIVYGKSSSTAGNCVGFRLACF